MKKLLLKIILLLAAIAVLGIFMRKLIYDKINPLPYSYGYNFTHRKAIYLKKHSSEFNTLFIGSSLTWAAFNPQLFDSLAAPSLQIHSFNFGIPGSKSSELFFILNSILRDSSMHPEYVFIELFPVHWVNTQNLHTTREFYWMNSENYLFTIRAVLGSNFKLSLKAVAIYTHTIGFFERLLNFGYVSDLNDFSKSDKSAHDTLSVLGDAYRGFASFEGVGGDKKSIKDPAENISLTQKFLKDTTGLTAIKTASEIEFQKFNAHPELFPKYNKVLYEKVNETCRQLKQKGIYPVFFLAPRVSGRTYKEILPLFHKIPQEHRILLADARKYPELYSVENSYDDIHLNKKGAYFFTLALAEEFNQIMKKNHPVLIEK